MHKQGTGRTMCALLVGAPVRRFPGGWPIKEVLRGMGWQYCMRPVRPMGMLQEGRQPAILLRRPWIRMAI